MSIKIITISGVDGSGKSTQVKKVQEYLQSRGAKPYYFHAIQFSIANSSKAAITKPGTEKAIISAPWTKIQLRKIALLIDFLRFEVLLSRLEKSDYTHIISDRYFYDSVINILYLSHGSQWKSFGASFLAHLTKVPDHALYLFITPEEVLRRERDIEQGREYLDEKVILYTLYAQNWGIERVDGEREPDEISHDITQKIT